MESIEVTDLYEAAYLAMKGGRLDGVACIPLSKSIACTFTFSGEALSPFQEAYRRKEAEVNLFAFRGAYTRVNGYMREAKKAYEKERRELRRERVSGEGAV
jgi:hypothetical protein